MTFKMTFKGDKNPFALPASAGNISLLANTIFSEIQALETEMTRLMRNYGRAKRTLDVSYDSLTERIGPGTLVFEFIRFPKWVRDEWFDQYGVMVFKSLSSKESLSLEWLWQVRRQHLKNGGKGRG